MTRDETLETETDPSAALPNKDWGDGPLVLDESIGIATAGELHARLTTLLDVETDITIDASHVQMVDAAALQVLVAFARSASNRHGTMRWQGVSETFCKAARLLDLTVHLGLEGKETATE